MDISRVWTASFGRTNLVGRALDYATFYLSAAWRLWRTVRRGDVVVVKTDPPLLSVVAGPIIRLRGAKLVNWLQDVFPEVLTVLQPKGGSAFGALPALRWLRNGSLRTAALNVAIGERMAERLRAENVDADRIAVIPNWADKATIWPIGRDGNPLRRKWGLKDKFVVGYSGNLGRALELDAILAAIETVNVASGVKNGAAHDRQIAFLFIGGGALRPRLEQAVKARGLSNVHLQPYQPNALLAQSLSAADVHIVSLKPELEGLIVPSKFYGVAAAGRPTIFIGHDDGEIPRLLRHWDCGMTVPPGDPQRLAAAILHLAANSPACTAMGARARARFEQQGDVAVAIERWDRALEAVAKGEPAAVAVGAVAA